MTALTPSATTTVWKRPAGGWSRRTCCPSGPAQPAKVTAHIHLADLLDLDTGSKLQQEWTDRIRGQWAAARAAASLRGSDGAPWLEGEAADGFACDASLTPVVFGTVNPAVIEHLIRYCLELAGHGPGRCTPTPHPDHTDPDHTDQDPDPRVSRCRVPSRCRPG